MPAEHAIIIRKADGFFSVCVEPPHPDVEPRVFCHERSARGWAGGIRMTKGWQKLDLTEEKSNG